jgi:hypothetical protein
MPEESMTHMLRSEFEAKLDAHRRELGFQLSGIERWIQTASTALDKVVELQIQIHTSREGQLMDRGMNDEFRRELKEDVRKLNNLCGEIKVQSAVDSVRISLIVGAGMVILNVALWAVGKFIA